MFGGHTKGTGHRGFDPHCIFFLLRVGEYTQKRRKAKTCTVQFRLQDIAFKNGDEIIPRSAPIVELMRATAATLRLSSQKKWDKGSVNPSQCNEGEVLSSEGTGQEIC